MALEVRLDAVAAVVLDGLSYRRAGRTAVFDYLEGFYNPRRRHSTLGYLSPVEYERRHPTSHPAA